jgi:hypothetical protein
MDFSVPPSCAIASSMLLKGCFNGFAPAWEKEAWIPKTRLRETFTVNRAISAVKPAGNRAGGKRRKAEFVLLRGCGSKNEEPQRGHHKTPPLICSKTSRISRLGPR